MVVVEQILHPDVCGAKKSAAAAISGEAETAEKNPQNSLVVLVFKF
jgi:hypothetical protein